MLFLQGAVVETTGPMSARRRKASGSRNGVLLRGARAEPRGGERIRWTGGEEGSDAGRVVGRAVGSGGESPGGCGVVGASSPFIEYAAGAGSLP